MRLGPCISVCNPPRLHERPSRCEFLTGPLWSSLELLHRTGRIATPIGAVGRWPARTYRSIITCFFSCVLSFLGFGGRVSEILAVIHAEILGYLLSAHARLERSCYTRVPQDFYLLLTAGGVGRLRLARSAFAARSRGHHPLRRAVIAASFPPLFFVHGEYEQAGPCVNALQRECACHFFERYRNDKKRRAIQKSDGDHQKSHL